MVVSDLELADDAKESSLVEVIDARLSAPACVCVCVCVCVRERERERE